MTGSSNSALRARHISSYIWWRSALTCKFDRPATLTRGHSKNAPEGIFMATTSHKQAGRRDSAHRADYTPTPDRRYFVVRGRLWRLSNPQLDPQIHERLVRDLMAARRAVRDATGSQ